MESSAKSYEAERRSTRIRAQIPLRVTSLDPAIQFSEQCHTLVVNTEGCGVRLSRPLEPVTPAAPVPLATQQDQWPYAQFSSRGEFHPGRK